MADELSFLGEGLQQVSVAYLEENKEERGEEGMEAVDLLPVHDSKKQKCGGCVPLQGQRQQKQSSLGHHLQRKFHLQTQAQASEKQYCQVKKTCLFLILLRSELHTNPA